MEVIHIWIHIQEFLDIFYNPDLSDLYENFVTDVYLDKKVSVKFGKSFGSWVQIQMANMDCRSGPDLPCQRPVLSGCSC